MADIVWTALWPRDTRNKLIVSIVFNYESRPTLRKLVSSCVHVVFGYIDDVFERKLFGTLRKQVWVCIKNIFAFKTIQILNLQDKLYPFKMGSPMSCQIWENRVFLTQAGARFPNASPHLTVWNQGRFRCPQENLRPEKDSCASECWELQGASAVRPPVFITARPAVKYSEAGTCHPLPFIIYWPCKMWFLDSSVLTKVWRMFIVIIIVIIIVLCVSSSYAPHCCQTIKTISCGQTWCLKTLFNTQKGCAARRQSCKGRSWGRRSFPSQPWQTGLKILTVP